MFRVTVGGVTYEYRDTDEMVEALRDLDAEYAGRLMDEPARLRWNAVNEQLEHARARSERIAELTRNGGGPGTERGATFHTRRVEAEHPSQRSPHHYRNNALRAIERNADVLSPEAGDRLDAFVRTGDRTGMDSRYLAAVADPAYAGAFHKVATRGALAHLSFTEKESAAWQEVIEAEAVRAMAVGTGSAGGYALPLTLDPTIMLTNDGSYSGVRDFARVETISTDKWKGVTSAGVVASYDPELSEVSDDTPTFGQPEADTAKAQAWIEYSIEIGQDWQGLQAELGGLLRDAKNNLENQKFYDGTGVDEPRGIMGGTGTLAIAVVTGAGSATFAVGDVYTLLQAVPTRWQQRTAVAASPVAFDYAYQLVGGNGPTPPLLPTREGAMIGRRKFEWSAMNGAVSTGNVFMIAGDWKQFLIADRVGLSVEFVQHVMGPNRRPMGKRGLYAFWRNTSTVLVPSAFRALKIK